MHAWFLAVRAQEHAEEIGQQTRPEGDQGHPNDGRALIDQVGEMRFGREEAEVQVAEDLIPVGSSSLLARHGGSRAPACSC